MIFCGSINNHYTANVVLENTFERIIVGDKWGEKRLGLFIIRGENVVLLGEIVRAVD